MSQAADRDSRAIPDDIDQPILWGETTAFLRVTIVLTWIGIALYDAIYYFQSGGDWRRIAHTQVLVVVGVVSWMLLDRGHVRAAVILFGAGVWSGLMFVVVLYGGVASTPIVVFPLIIIFAGWVAGERAAWLTAIATIGATLLLLVADRLGWLPALTNITSTARTVTQCFTLLFSAVLVSYLLRAYRSRLAQVRKLSSDLSERTAALQATEADLNRAQAVASMGSWVYDLAKDKMTLSDETCRIFGLPTGTTGSHESYVGRVMADERESVQAAWREAIERRQTFDHEHRIALGRKFRWVRQCAEFQYDDEGRALRAVGTTQDVTERKRAEEVRMQLEAQLRESQKMEALGTLAGGIAHDFNNVLAAIMGNVDLAKQDVGDRHVATQSLNEIAGAASRARSLVQQILAFSRRQVLRKEPMHLAPVLEDTVRLLRSTQPPGVTLELRCDTDVPTVMADATQIAQILVNLCTNAWHALEGQDRAGVVAIRLAAWDCREDAARYSAAFVAGNPAPGVYACMTVSDNGAGMEAQTMRRIFEPFFTTKATDKGTGLGLAVVHGIVQAHDACIAVESAPGTGTTFTICFPQATEAAREDGAAQLKTATPGMVAVPAPSAMVGHGKHVLYVDDDEALVLLFSRVLQRRGYRVTVLTEPQAAIDAVRAAPNDFDLVVTDFNMPGVSGLALAQAVRDIRADLPVAMASGYLTSDLQDQARAAGVSELIQKPDSIEELCNTVARLVGAAIAAADPQLTDAKTLACPPPPSAP